MGTLFRHGINYSGHSSRGGPAVLEHSLTIGDKVFDGSADVIVEIYQGEMEDYQAAVAMMYNLSETPQTMTIINDTLTMNSTESLIQMTSKTIDIEDSSEDKTVLTMNVNNTFQMN